MIITVTLNPAIDKTVSVEQLRTGELNRIKECREDAGGKGINVSKTIKSLGGESVATGFLGGSTGQQIADALEKLEIANKFIQVNSRTRTNMKVVDHAGVVTEINEPGPVISEPEQAQLLQALKRLVKSGDLVILSGSIPRGVSVGIYRQLTKEIHDLGGKVFVDADGALLAEAVKEKPDIVKPNLSELEQYCKSEGIPVGELSGQVPEQSAESKSLLQAEQSTESKSLLQTEQSTESEPLPQTQKLPEKVQPLVGHAVRMGTVLRQKGIREVIVSMGGDGAVFLTEEGNAYVPALPVTVRSTVGAGDAMAAAYAYAGMKQESLRERICLSVAVSAGAVTTEGTNPAAEEEIRKLKEKVLYMDL